MIAESEFGGTKPVPLNSSSENPKNCVLNDRRIGVRRYKTRTAEIQFGEPKNCVRNDRRIGVRRYKTRTAEIQFGEPQKLRS